MYKAEDAVVIVFSICIQLQLSVQLGLIVDNLAMAQFYRILNFFSADSNSNARLLKFITVRCILLLTTCIKYPTA